MRLLQERVFQHYRPKGCCQKDGPRQGALLAGADEQGPFPLPILSLVARSEPHAGLASTTAGTTIADFATRSLGIGYTGGSALLLFCVIASLAVWHRATGSISVDRIADVRSEVFYWITITFSQTLGTALGDWMADTSGLGYLGAAIVFGAGLAILAALYFWTQTSRVFLFWAAFILTRPLGATVGDFLDKPFGRGGLDLSRPLASLVLAAVMIGLIIVLPQRAGRHPESVA